MKAVHDASSDRLTIKLAPGKIQEAPAQVYTAEQVRIFRAHDGVITQIEFDDARKRGLVPVRTLGQRVTARQGWAAFKDLVAEYNWPTKTATLALALAAFVSIGKEFPCIAGDLCLSESWRNALSSDGMLTLLSLTVAFCIGIHIKLRQAQGLVDGSENYSIGRALAYGYFSNFIVGAMLTLRAEGDRLGMPAGHRPVMHIVFPTDVEKLDTFRHSIEKNVRVHTEPRNIEGLAGVHQKLFKRSLLALSQLDDTGRSVDAYYLDFPTTLYTMHDYLQSWNAWLDRNGRESLREHQVRELQQKYISDFFAHLKELSGSDMGVEAASRLGANLTAHELSQMYEEHITVVDPEQILTVIETRARRGQA